MIITYNIVYCVRDEEFDSFCSRFTTMFPSDGAWWLPYQEPCVTDEVTRGKSAILADDG